MCYFSVEANTFFVCGQAVNRLIAITSELEQWEEMDPKCKLLSIVLCTDAELCNI